jgi:hypothetical protein
LIYAGVHKVKSATTITSIGEIMNLTGNTSFITGGGDKSIKCHKHNDSVSARLAISGGEGGDKP